MVLDCVKLMQERLFSLICFMYKELVREWTKYKKREILTEIQCNLFQSIYNILHEQYNFFMETTLTTNI